MGSSVDTTTTTEESEGAGETTPKGVYRGGKKATGLVTGKASGSSKHVLTAAFLTGVVFVAIRVVADYEAKADGTVKGKIGHPTGQYGPLPILAGLIGTFFILSLLASGGGNKAKVAAIFGWVVVLTLAMFSLDEFNTASGTFKTFGKAQLPADTTSADWQTSGQPAGALLQYTGSAPSDNTSGSSGSSGTTKGDTPPSPSEPVGLQVLGQAADDIKKFFSWRPSWF